MTIKVLSGKGISNREIAQKLGVSEGMVRYQRRRLASGAEDGRSAIGGMAHEGLSRMEPEQQALFDHLEVPIPTANAV